MWPSVVGPFPQVTWPRQNVEILCGELAIQLCNKKLTSATLPGLHETTAINGISASPLKSWCGVAGNEAATSRQAVGLMGPG
jgi:hypothetical protein